MTPEELEAERAALLALIESGEPMTDDIKQRGAAVAAEDMAKQPKESK